MPGTKKTVGEAATETTAIISILLEHPRKSNTNSLEEENIRYSIHLSFVGATILPPFLPCIKETVDNSDRNSILEKMVNVGEIYMDSYSDFVLAPQESQIIKKKVREIGKDIANYLPHFTNILENIAKMRVSNIIIHTDDFAIPWTWAYYNLTYNQMQYLPDPPDLEAPPTDFLCNRYPCGTLIVDSEEDAFNRVQKFRDNFISRSTNERHLGQLEVSLFQGVLPGDKYCLKEEKNKYLENLQVILKKRFKEDNIHSSSMDDWRNSSGHPEKFVKNFRAGNVTESKIVHYLGHVDDCALKPDEKTAVSPNHLSDLLFPFSQSPLVVLHGCSSGKIVDMNKKEKQLPTVFLEKGASGCVAALLPVSMPIYREEVGAETMIDIFYRKVVVEMKPYGQALYEARHEFQKQKETQDDPQWLFFHLYGDPRAMLITTSGKGHLRDMEVVLESMEKENLIQKKEKKKPSPDKEFRIGLFYDGDLVDKDELFKELKSIGNEGDISIKRESATIALGPSPMLGLLTSPEAIDFFKILLQMVPGAEIIYPVGIMLKIIFDFFEKRGKKLEKIDPSKTEEMRSKGEKIIGLRDFSDPTSPLDVYIVVNI
jgi:hypothetical protein